MTASPASEDDKVVLNNPKPVPRPGTWISAAIVTVLGAMLIHGLVTNEKFHWDTVWFFFREVRVVRAVGWTLLLTFLAMAIGIVLAVTTAIMRQSSNPILRWVALGYLWFFRGTREALITAFATSSSAATLPISLRCAEDNLKVRPGIAGFVLTIGTAVDANVLIFSRIREEIANGMSIQRAIHEGFDRAFSAILDGNLTTLLVGGILFAMGTGPIKGFAVTLSIGILTSMFTAIIVTRGMVNLIYGGRDLKKLWI